MNRNTRWNYSNISFKSLLNFDTMHTSSTLIKWQNKHLRWNIDREYTIEIVSILTRTLITVLNDEDEQRETRGKRITKTTRIKIQLPVRGKIQWNFCRCKRKNESARCNNGECMKLTITEVPFICVFDEGSKGSFRAISPGNTGVRVLMRR